MTKTLHPFIDLGTPMRWTLERYHELIEAGVLDEGDRVELLFGQIIPVSPIGRFHAASVSKITELFNSRLVKKYAFRQEQPTSMKPSSEPEPDGAVVDRSPDYYASGHPTPSNVLLLIEVADATLQRDQNGKKVLYASVGIPEYWIVNLIERRLEIYTQPNSDTLDYDEVVFHPEGSEVTHDLVGKFSMEQILP